MRKTPSVTIHLMDLYTGETGKVRWHTYPRDKAPYETAGYQWTDGNWGCDCNRWREWLKVNPKAVYEYTDSMCGEPRIRARLLVGTDQFDDWPDNEAERIEWANKLKAERKELIDQWSKE